MDLLGSPLPTYIQQAILIAIEGGNINSLKSCFNTNKNEILEFRSPEGYNALELAISVGSHLEMIQFLIEKGLLVNIHKALELAVTNPQKDIVELILNHEKKRLECSVPQDVLFALQDEKGSVKNAHLDIAREEPCINKPYPNSEEDSLLHLAIKANEESIVTLLLKRGADVNRKNTKGFTPLHTAAANLQVNFVKILLNHRDIRIVSRNNKGLTPLELAFMSAQEESTLTESTKNAFSYLDKSSENINDLSLHKNSKEIIDLLIKRASKEDKQYFLYRATRDSFPKIVETLLKDPEVEINAPYKHGWRILHLAVSCKDKKIIEILLDKKADFTLFNDTKISPFGLALQNNEMSIIDLFVKALSIHKSNEEFIQNFLKDLKNNFFSALQRGEKRIIETLLNQNKTLSMHIPSNYDYDKWIPSINMLAEQDYYRWAPIHFAAFYGHTELVEWLLQNGCNPLHEDSMQRTALHLVIGFSEHSISKNKKTAIIEALLKHSPELLDKTYDNENKTALKLALRNQEPSMIEFLLTYHPKIGLEDTLHWAASYQKKNTVQIIKYLLANFTFTSDKITDTLHLVLLHSKIEKKDLKEITELLLAKNAQINTPSTRTGKTPLIIAIQQNKEELVDLLLEQKGIQANITDKDSFNALNHAVYNLSMLEKLIKHFHINNYLCNQVENPLFSAISANQKPAVQLLLPYFKNSNKYCKELGSVFAWAAEHGHLDIAESVLEYGFDINTLLNFKRKKHVPALSIAAEKGQTEMVKFLVNRGAKTSLLDSQGWAPLHLSIKGGHQESALALIYSDPATIHLQVGAMDDAPIHLAAEYGLDKVVDVLIDKKVNINIKNLSGESPLHFAIGDGFEKITFSLIEAGADIYSRTDGEMLDENGELVDTEDFSTLHLAAQSGSTKIAKKLLDAGIDPNIKTKNGITPLHSLIHPYEERRNSALPILNLLIESGARVDSEAFIRQTPIHLGVEFGDLEVVKRLVEEYDSLLKKGEPVKDIINQSTPTPIRIRNTVEYREYTPIHIATHYGHFAVFKYLLDHGIDMAQNKQGWVALELAAAGKMQPQKNSTIYLPETPLSPKRYPSFLQSPGNSIKEDSPEISTLKSLLNKYLLYFSLSNEEKSQLLNIAIRSKKEEITAFLLNQEGFSPNYKNAAEEYPIQISAMVGSPEFIELLVSKGAIINLKNAKPPISCAADYNQIEIIEWLLEHNVDLTLLDPVYLRNPIHFAVINGSQEALVMLLNHAKSKNIDKKLVNSQDTLALTPLHLSVIYSQDKEIIKTLLNHGAEINKVADLATKDPSEHKWTAMNFALHSENPEIISLLFSARALPDENTADPNQWSAFFKTLLESTDIFKQKDISSTVKHLIATHYTRCIFDILNNSQAKKELNASFISVLKIFEVMSRQTTHYIAGKPMDNFDHLIGTPDLALRMLKTPGSSAVDPRTGYIVSPPRQQIATIEQDPVNSASASRRHHYARFR